MSTAFFDEEPVCLFERPKDHNVKNPGPEDKEERRIIFKKNTSEAVNYLLSAPIKKGHLCHFSVSSYIPVRSIIYFFRLLQHAAIIRSLYIQRVF